MSEQDLRKAIEKALREYHRTGTRELPSVRKSVPRPFRDAVDSLVEALEQAVKP